MNTYLSSIEIPKPAHLGTGSWTLTGLTGITVLFGKNGSGKSLLLRSWRNIDPVTSHYVVPERTGPIDYNPRFLQQQADPTQRSANSSRNWANEYRQQIIGRIQAYFITRGASRETQLPGDPAELESLINQLFPDFVVGLSSGSPPYTLTRASSDQSVTTVDDLSSGEAQLVTLSLDILTMAAIWDIENREKRLMLIDEPDAHIHPDLQARLADFLVQVGTRFKLQIVVATHSTTLLSALGQFGGEDTSIQYIDRTHSQFAAKRFSSVLKELSACLGGHVLMGALFGVPLLLVEGDDDYRIWSQVPRHHVINLAVIPCNGEEIKDYQKSLELILSSLRDEGEFAGYALLDKDKNLPDPKVTPQKHILFVRTSCHEAENLYLTDEVLADMGLTWHEAKILLVNQASEFGNKAPIIADAADWDRRREDIKNVIEEISRILDPKNVHWTVRVGKVLGRQRPEGLIREFLGDDVVVKLWGPEKE